MEHAEEQQQETRKENEEGETTRPDAWVPGLVQDTRETQIWEVLSISSPQSEEVQQLIPPTSRTVSTSERMIVDFIIDTQHRDEC